MKAWARKLEVIQGVFDRSVSDLAKKYRKEVIKPLCQKHGLEFTSGMGTFFFSKGKVNVGSSPHGEDEWQLYIDCNLKPILDTLDLEVSHNQVFGYYVSDVKPINRHLREVQDGNIHGTPKVPHTRRR